LRKGWPIVSEGVVSKQRKFKVSFIDAFLWFNVLLLPIFDNASGLLFKLNIIGDGSIGSPSQLGRLIATFCVMVLITKLCSKDTKKIAFILFSYFILVEVFSALIHWQLMAFLYGMVTSLKVIYAAFCLLFFLELVKKNKITQVELEQWMVIYGTVISILVLLAYVSGFHIANYSTGIATRGLFISGNGLGVVMGCCALVLIHRMRKFKLVHILHILILLSTTALVGTKGGLIFFVFGLLYLGLKMSRQHPILTTAMLIVIAYYAIAPLLDVLGSVFNNIIYKFNNIDDKWLLLASSRDKFILEAFEKVTWFGAYSLRFIFGAGAYFGYLDPAAGAGSIRKLLENDLFELFFCYGILASLGYCCLFFYGAFYALVYKKLFYFILFSLVFLHSITAGHVVFNGTSSIMLAFIFATILCSNKYAVRKDAS
jgi:hypothetical protein